MRLPALAVVAFTLAPTMVVSAVHPPAPGRWDGAYGGGLDPAVTSRRSASDAAHRSSWVAAPRMAAPASGTDLVDLGTLSAGATGAGLAGSGAAVGTSVLADGTYHGVSYPADHGFPLDLGAQRTLPAYSQANAISPNGANIVGDTEPTWPVDGPDVHQTYHAGWFHDGIVDDLGTIQQALGNGGETGCGGLGIDRTGISYARAVNDHGTVVGLSDYTVRQCIYWTLPDNTFPPAHAFRFQLGNAMPDHAAGGSMEDLGTFNDSPGGPGGDCAFSGALAIDALGAIVGDAGRADWGGFGTAPTTDGLCYPAAVDQADPVVAHAFLLPAGASRGQMIDLGEPAGGTGLHAYSEGAAINAHLIVVNAQSDDGVMHAYLYDRATGAYRGTGGTATEIGSLGGSTLARAINAGDEVVGSSNGKAFVYSEGTLTDLNTLLPSGSPWTLTSARAINDHGDIVGTGQINGVNHAYFLRRCLVTPDQLADRTTLAGLADTDHDGLPDCWETGGVRVLEPDGTVKTVLTLPGAKVGRRDLYVELDSVAGHAIPTPSFAMVVAAFRRAPVSNLDGSTGITLHLDPSDSIPPTAVAGLGAAATVAMPWPPPTSAPTPPAAGRAPTLRWIEDGVPLAGDVCPGYFGSRADRTAANCADRLRARHLVYRYALLAGLMENGPGTAGMASGVPASDLTLFDNGYPAALVASFGGTVEFQARTFMHELGHTLGLRHGGGDDVNCKPNYQSIMNYSYPDVPVGPGMALFPLDYSSSRLPTLQEGSLAEPVGIGPYQWNRVMYGVGGVAVIRPTTGAVDWNDDGATTGSGVSEPISWIDSESCSGSGTDTGNSIVNGRWILLRPTAALDPTRIPRPGSFRVTAGAATIAVVAVRVLPSAIPGQASKISLRLARAVGSGDAVQVAYTPGAAGSRLTSVAGTAVSAFSFALANHTADRPQLDGYDDWGNLVYGVPPRPDIGLLGPRRATADERIVEPTATQAANTAIATIMYGTPRAGTAVTPTGTTVVRKGRSVTVQFKLARLAVIVVEIVNGSKVVASSQGTLAIGKTTVSLKLPKAPSHGRDTVRITTVAGGRATVTTRTLR